MGEKRILHVITGLGRGGAERMLYEILRNQVDLGYRPIVISLSSDGVYGEKIRALGVPVRSLGIQSRVPDPFAVLRLRHLIRKEDPLVVHAWMYHGMLAGLMATSGRPLIAMVRHSLYDLGDEKPLTRLVIRACAHLSGRFARITYNSHISRTQHEAIGYDPARALVIPNGFDTELLRPDPARRQQMRKALGIGPDQRAVFQLARLHPMKDHAGFLAAIAEIDNPSLVFLFAGTGVEPGNAPFEGVRDPRIRLLGERDDVPDLLQAADLLVNPSSSEAFPNVLGEAMACGVPCVATDVGDSTLIIGDTGFIVPPRDPRALAAAILRMASLDETERQSLGNRARARIVANYSMAGLVQAYEALYESVIAEQAQARH